MTLGELIDELGGTLVQGDPEWTIDGVNSCEHAGPFELCFADSSAAIATALAGHAKVIVLPPGTAAAYPHGMSVVEAAQPRLFFARAAKLLKPQVHPSGIHKTASVSTDAIIGAGVSIAAGVVIESHVHIGEGTSIDAGVVIGRGVQIGESCHIYPRVVLYTGTTLGDRVIVHAGAVLGADGFGYVRDVATGAYTQFPQQGKLVIEDDVEIGANSTIDRGALEETRIHRGTKIDNLVHIGHNCDIGEDVILVALTGISGSSSVGKGAVIAGQVGIGDHAHVGPGVILGGQAGVLNGKTVTNEGLKPGTVLWGTPARPLRQVLREQATLIRLAKRSAKDSGKENDG
jgi:UDP-3-O-[3-hydroxymyristoyl] glucosamine N-acyltransferase